MYISSLVFSNLSLVGAIVIVIGFVQLALLDLAWEQEWRRHCCFRITNGLVGYRGCELTDVTDMVVSLGGAKSFRFQRAVADIRGG